MHIEIISCAFHERYARSAGEFLST